MGEIIKINEQQSTADRLREQIRHTESDITETVQSLEQRLSPRYLRQRGSRKAKRLAWQGTAKLLEFAQRRSVQASVLGAGALLMLISNRKVRSKITPKKPVVPERYEAGTAAKAVGATALWMLSRKPNAGKEIPARKPAVSGMALAATAAKAFLSGARASEKSGTTRPGSKAAWRGLATAIGAALGNYWYGHKEHRV
ncbi:MAG: hypothetical protein A2075_20775 [Geobacteraceae bacterium GWC2_58_44]|nr:MAG: hypothetical protein A2075_20775 [Geobacteraceae bacterium GWC2_58_44]HBG05286.1 hypothetical protein [Geobacter sp.]